MTVHQRSVEVMASADDVFRLLLHPENLPDCFSPVTAAERVGPDLIRLDLDGGGPSPVTVRVDPDGPTTRLGWEALDTPYTGAVILQQAPDLSGSESCIVTVIVDDHAPESGSGLDTLTRTHDAGRFGGSHGREALPPLGTAGEGATPAGLSGLGPGDIIERALGRFREYIENRSR